MPSPSPRRRRSLTPSSTPAPAPPEARDGAALPRDVLFDVFLRLGPREIMRGAERACTGWRRAAVEEPALWRRVDMTAVPTLSRRRWQAMSRAAVDRGAGQCEAFSGPCDDDLLLYLVERAPSLRSLHLSHDNVSKIALNVEILERLPLLEDVEISLSYFSDYVSQKLFESICQACPGLKKLRMSFDVCHDSNYYDDYMDSYVGDAYTIPVMCELRSLELLCYDLTAAGLTAILDNCPLLETLNISSGNIIIMDEELQAKCARVKNLTLPCYSDDEYYEEYDPDQGFELDSDDEFYY
ncbi:hypothetical protein ACP70R_003483 [Stipagrostis hirtigluma subsp. patula]